MPGTCHICGEEMDPAKEPKAGQPGIGLCSEHGISYDDTYSPTTEARRV